MWVPASHEAVANRLCRLPVSQVDVPPQGPSIKQFMDIFSLPEMALLSCVVDYFLGHGLEFDQVHLYKDVTVRGWLLCLRRDEVCLRHGRPFSLA